MRDETPPAVRRLYIARMTRPGGTQRYRVWEITGDRLTLLQPPDPHMRTRASLLPFQRFSMNEGYDAFHFVIPPGVIAADAIGAALSKLWNFPVTVVDLVDQVAPRAFDRLGMPLTVVP